MPAQVPFTFKIYSGDTLVRTETVTQDRAIKIGKLSSSHLRIDDESASRMHAVIEITDSGEYFIIDLGSTKGTIVNGQKVNKAKLQSGDTIVIGNTKLVVTIGEPVASAMDDGPTQVSKPPVAAPPPPQTRQTVMGMQPPKIPTPPAPAES